MLGPCLSCRGAASDEPAALVARLDARIPEVVAHGRLPSIQAAVVRRDRVVWSRAYGAATSVDHVYMNGSVQKVFDGVAVLRLVEQGAVDLDRDVGSYLPFPVRHPRFPNRAITLRMLLGHRAGLIAFPHQFAWDTECRFARRDRPPCDTELPRMSLGQYVAPSLQSGNPEAVDDTWSQEPGTRLRYSVAAYPLMRYLVEQVSQQSFPQFMRENVIGPLEMTRTGFTAGEFADQHAVPHARVHGENVELPVWNGNGFVMHATAADQARLTIALMNGGRIGNLQLLRPETLALMSSPTSRFRVLFRVSDDLQSAGHGLGLFVFRGGWLGYGGSTQGFQCLWRFHPTKRVGYVILSNVNAIQSGPEDLQSVRRDIYSVQNALLAVLDPWLTIRNRAGELAILGAVTLAALLATLVWRRAARPRISPVP